MRASRSDGLRPAAAKRLVLLGASNLTRGLGAMLETAGAALPPGPSRVLVAAGHGRSYGASSRVLARTLPGIVDCGLWKELETGAPAPLYALLTDVGNDLAYGFAPDRVAAWVETCVRRLRAGDARVVLTRLPLANLHRLRPWQFRLLRALLFPGRRLARELVLARAADLDRRLVEIGRRWDVPTPAPAEDWFGLDAIHLRRRCRHQAWRSAVSCWPGARPGTGPRGRLPRPAAVWAGAERVRLLGVSRHRPQPVRAYDDGSSLSLY